MTVTERGEPGCTFHTVFFVAPTESSCVPGWLFTVVVRGRERHGGVGVPDIIFSPFNLRRKSECRPGSWNVIMQERQSCDFSARPIGLHHQVHQVAGY